jgi:glycosyltransferase involved in cell wall biosynthesis
VILDICIPAFNEEDIIEEAIGEVRHALASLDIAARLTVASNGSTDGTVARAQMMGVEVLDLPEAGKGGAVIAAAKLSKADYFGFIDADLSANPSDIKMLFAPLIQGEADIAIGSRLQNTRLVKRELFRTLSSRLFNSIRSVLLGISVEDTQCGLKLMNTKGKEKLVACIEKGWFFDMEFLARANHAGLRIKEMAIHWDENRFPKRKSKLNVIRDGIAGIFAMVRIRRALD